MRNAVAISWLTSATLGGVAATMSNPNYYLWSVASLLFFAVAYASLTLRKNRRMLVVGYVAVGAYSFIVGRLLFGHGQLTDGGVTAMLLVLPAIAYLPWRFYKTEAAAT